MHLGEQTKLAVVGGDKNEEATVVKVNACNTPNKQQVSLQVGSTVVQRLSLSPLCACLP